MVSLFDIDLGFSGVQISKTYQISWTHFLYLINNLLAYE